MQKVKVFYTRGVRLLFLALILLLAGAIFCMSNEPATASAAHSSSLAHTILKLFCRELDTLPEAVQAERLAHFDHILRKAAHFCVYGALGALLFLYSLCFAAKPHLHVLRAEAAAALYAASDELHQAFVPGRGPAVTDVL